MLSSVEFPDGARAAARPSPELKLIAGFDLRYDGLSVLVPGGGRRVVAFLALHDRPLRRAYVAGCLWPDETEEHAGARLRGALSRLRRAGIETVLTIGDRLSLAPHVTVDVHEVSRTADLLAQGGPLPENCAAWLQRLTGELLPDWYDDWVLIERDRYEQLRLHALEALCGALAGAGRFSLAVQAGLAAVAADPLRESAHRSLITAYLGEGNPGEALRQYARYRHAADELGVAPTERMEMLVRAARQGG